MFTLSANLEYMFKEAGDSLEARIAAAAAAGINKVEIFSLDGRDIETVAAALNTHQVHLHSMVVDPRIMLVLPDTHAKFLQVFRATAEQAVQLGCKHLVCGSGTGAPFLKRSISLLNVADAIAKAADIAKEFGLTIWLEAVNTRVDHPGVFFSKTEDTLFVASKVNRPEVRVLYDIYHSVAEGENVADELAKVKDWLGHVQVADYPGRGEPGSGNIVWPVILQQLTAAGYRGDIGVECYPTLTDTPQALSYFTQLLLDATITAAEEH